MGWPPGTAPTREILRARRDLSLNRLWNAATPPDTVNRNEDSHPVAMPARTAVEQRPVPHTSSRIREGSSMTSLTLTRNETASRPSTTR